MKTRSHRAFPTDLIIPSRLEFVALYFDRLGYRVHVAEFGCADAEILEIDFGLNPLAQRSMDEGKYLDMSWEPNLVNGPIGSIALVDNSEFLDWFQAKSLGIYAEDDVFHVAILTQNEWVEVICSQLPTIKAV